MPAATEAAPAAPMDKPLYPSGLRPPSRQGHYASPAAATTTTVTASNSQQEIPTLTAAAPETLNSTKVNNKKETKRRRSSKARNKSRSVPTSEERVGPPPPPPATQEKKKARSVSRSRRRSSKSLKPEELLKKSDTTKSSKPTEDSTTTTKMSLSGTSESSSSFLPKTLVSPARGRSSKNTKDRSKATASPSPLRLMVPGGFMTPTKTRSSSSSGRLSPKGGRLSPCNANTKPSTNKGITSKTSKKSMTGKTMIAKKEKGQRALMSQSARTASGSSSTRRPLETKPKRKRKSGGGLSQSAREPARTSSTSSLSSSASDLDQSSDFMDRSISLLDELRLDKSTRGTRSSTLEQRSSLAMPAAYCIEDPLMSKSAKNPLFDELRADKSTRTRSLELSSPLRMDRLSQSESNLRYQNYDDALPIPDGSARSRTPRRAKRETTTTINKRMPRRDREKSQRQRPKSSKEDSEPPPLMDPSKQHARHSSPIPTKPYNELNKPQQSNRRSSTQSQEDSDDDYDSDSNGKQLFVLPRQLSLDQNSSQSNTSATDECESDEDEEELEEEELTVSQSTPPPPTKTLGKSVSFNEEAIEYEGEDVIREWYSKEFLAQLIHHEVQIVSRAAASDSNNNSGNYKSLHCCWRGLEHIQRRLDKGQHIRDHVLGALQKQVLLWKKQQQPMEEVLRHFSRTSSKEDRKRALVLGMEDAKFVARQNEFDRKCDQHDEELKKNGRMTMANYVSDSFRDASFSVSTAAMTKMVSDVVGGAATPKPVVTPLRETTTTTTRQHPGSGSKLRGS